MMLPCSQKRTSSSLCTDGEMVARPGKTSLSSDLNVREYSCHTLSRKHGLFPFRRSATQQHMLHTAARRFVSRCAPSVRSSLFPMCHAPVDTGSLGSLLAPSARPVYAWHP